MSSTNYDPSDVCEVWFAVDAAGHVAVFASEYAGRPLSNDYMRRCELLRRRLNDLATSSSYTMEPGISKYRAGMYDRFPNKAEMENTGLYALEAFCRGYAEKGLFCYSSVFQKGIRQRRLFYRVGSPLTPVAVSKLDSAVGDGFRQITFPTTRFDRAPLLDIVTGLSYTAAPGSGLAGQD